MQNLNAVIEQNFGHLLTGDYNIGNKEELIAKLLEELLYHSDDSDHELDIKTFRLCNYYDTLQNMVNSRKRKKEDERRQPKIIFKLDSNPFYQSYLHPDRIEILMHAYCITGLPGCIGSVDCVHIDWEAPYELVNKTKNGRYGGSRKTMVFQAAVNNRSKILSATTAFYGTWNDATITQYDSFVQSVIRGRYKYVQYDVYDNNGQVIKQKGCWLLVDGGYPKTIPHLQYPSGNSDDSDAWALRKHMESVRKDVECTFGRLKKRFLILKLTIRCKDESIVAPIFHTCCALHNMYEK